jgi:hypothetical protein
LRSREGRTVWEVFAHTEQRYGDRGYRGELRGWCGRERGASLGERAALRTVARIMEWVPGCGGAHSGTRGALCSGSLGPVCEGREPVQR